MFMLRTDRELTDSLYEPFRNVSWADERPSSASIGTENEDLPSLFLKMSNWEQSSHLQNSSVAFAAVSATKESDSYPMIQSPAICAPKL